MSTKEPMFPILGDDVLRAVPWAMLAKHEAQAKANHGGQSLNRLAERGGLAPSEAWAIYHGRPLPWPNGPAQAEQYLIIFMRDIATWLSRRDALRAGACPECFGKKQMLYKGRSADVIDFCRTCHGTGMSPEVVTPPPLEEVIAAEARGPEAFRALLTKYEVIPGAPAK